MPVGVILQQRKDFYSQRYIDECDYIRSDSSHDVIFGVAQAPAQIVKEIVLLHLVALLTNVCINIVDSKTKIISPNEYPSFCLHYYFVVSAAVITRQP